MPIIETEINTGDARRVGLLELTPVNQILKIQVPGNRIGLIWNRPKAVVVRGNDGQEEILPVRDVTRIAIWAMLAGGLIGAIMIGMMFRHR